MQAYSVFCAPYSIAHFGAVGKVFWGNCEKGLYCYYPPTVHTVPPPSQGRDNTAALSDINPHLFIRYVRTCLSAPCEWALSSLCEHVDTRYTRSRETASRWWGSAVNQNRYPFSQNRYRQMRRGVV
jgi:hypothetical protein